jgi:uncharacterized hydantoinase/oxoprolinase family protein
MRKKIITGWDIGGAHLKAAIVSQANEVIGIYQHYPICRSGQMLMSLR